MMISETTYSLSEIEVHAKKAVRGAGFSWGYAEEAAKSVRFLAAHQLPGAVVLAAYLHSRDTEGGYAGPVMGENGVWSVAVGAKALCPVLSGACLCDNAQALGQGDGGLVLEQLAYPLLVVPYLALISWQAGQSVRIGWDGVELVCHEGRIERVVCDNDALVVARVGRFECGVVAEAGGGGEAGKLGQVINDAVWRELDGFAQHTYVPATEESRRGAGPAD